MAPDAYQNGPLIPYYKHTINLPSYNFWYLFWTFTQLFLEKLLGQDRITFFRMVPWMPLYPIWSYFHLSTYFDDLINSAKITRSKPKKYHEYINNQQEINRFYADLRYHFWSFRHSDAPGTILVLFSKYSTVTVQGVLTYFSFSTGSATRKCYIMCTIWG